MKNRLLIFLAMVIAIMSICAISSNAATTSEFADTPEVVPGIDLTTMNSETDKRIVIVDANGEYHTYPANYFVSNSTTFTYNFTPFKNATGISYSKHDVIRVEVPDNILEAGNCKDLSGTNNLEEIVFSPNSQLQKLNYGCFYANKKLKKVNIPASVTTIETLVINHSTLEELIFDDGFSAVLPKDSFSGASGVKKVVFSNQMTTVEDRALDSTLGTSLQEFRMGASLKNLGTNNMAWVKQSVKFYIPSQFLSEASQITMETFSWWDSSACLPTGVIFFTGSKAQMDALIAKSTYDRVICSGAELVEWDPEKTDDEYVPTSGWRIVYNYNNCKAFYKGVHDFDNDCTTADACANICGATATKYDAHNISEAIEYPNGFASTGILYSGCLNPNCQPLAQTTAPAIFVMNEHNGFSESGKDGIAFGGYCLNATALDEYNRVNKDAPVKYGVVLINPDYLDGQDSFFVNGKVNSTTENKGFLQTDMSSARYANISISVTGFTGKAENLSIILAIYAYTDDSDVEFIQSQTTECASERVTLGETSLYTVTLASVKAGNSNLSDLGDYFAPKKDEE